MKKQSNIKRNEESGVIILSDSTLHCWDMIEELMQDIPDKRKKEYKTWKDEINRIIIHSNKLAGHKAYNIIK